MTITDERKTSRFFRMLYFDAGQALLVKKGSQIKSVDDLNASTTVQQSKVLRRLRISDSMHQMQTFWNWKIMQKHLLRYNLARETR